MPTGVLQTGETLEWGVDQEFTGYILTARNVDKSPRIKREIADQNGMVVTVVGVDFTTTLQCTMIVKVGTAAPEFGDVLTDVALAKWFVNDVKLREANETEQITELELKDYEGITLP